MREVIVHLIRALHGRLCRSHAHTLKMLNDDMMLKYYYQRMHERGGAEMLLAHSMRTRGIGKK